jgi:hypothetical protein
VDRTTVLWTIVVFLGASVLFGLVRNATEGESTGVMLAAQAAAGLLLVGAIVLIVRRLR